jgi:hypothetical protein
MPCGRAGTREMVGREVREEGTYSFRVCEVFCPRTSEGREE